MFDQFLEKELVLLEQKGLKRELKVLETSQGTKVFIEGKEYLNFNSNNYLGLANASELSLAAMKSLKKDGFGSGASRLVSGTMKEHVALEKELADFKATEAAIVFNCGYMANVGIISSLFSKGDLIFSDRLNHASIIDGILLSRAEYYRYPHCDMNALEELLKNSDHKKKKVIITDSVFSMDGDIAPLDKIVCLAQQYNCITMIDEAHALGVMGKDGKGLAQHFGVEEGIDIQMGTLSKAVGSFGAYCCGSKKMIEVLQSKARSFIYTTSLPPSVLAASRKAIEMIRSSSVLKNQLWANVYFVSQKLRDLGFDLLQSETPIIPIIVKDTYKALDFSRKLFDNGIFISAIRPPTVPVNMARLRLTITALHTREDCEFLVKTIKEVGQDLNLIK